MAEKIDHGEKAAAALQRYSQAELHAPLNPRELTVLEMRTGVDGPRATFSQVAERLRVNDSRARAIQNDALVKLARKRENAYRRSFGHPCAQRQRQSVRQVADQGTA